MSRPARGDDVVFASRSRYADRALYVAKERGRERVVSFRDLDAALVVTSPAAAVAI